MPYSHLHHREIERLYRESARRAQKRRSEPSQRQRQVQRTIKWGSRAMVLLVFIALLAFDLFVLATGPH